MGGRSTIPQTRKRERARKKKRDRPCGLRSLPPCPRLGQEHRRWPARRWNCTRPHYDLTYTVHSQANNSIMLELLLLENTHCSRIQRRPTCRAHRAGNANQSFCFAVVLVVNYLQIINKIKILTNVYTHTLHINKYESRVTLQGADNLNSNVTDD